VAVNDLLTVKAIFTIIEVESRVYGDLDNTASGSSETMSNIGKEVLHGPLHDPVQQ
jgi:putative exporter of polyketide antibiotics